MSVLDLIDELEKLIESGNNLPFSSKSLIPPEDALEIIDEIKHNLPIELKEAQEIVAKKKQILVEAQEDADNIRDEAEKTLRNMIDTNEVVRKAHDEAARIIENAQESSKQIRIGTHRYADEVLFKVQKQLKIINDMIETNREELMNE